MTRKSWETFKQKNLGIDKTFHFFAGFVLFVVFNIVFESMLGRGTCAVSLALGMVYIAAFSKEIKDQITYGGFDLWDILTTVLVPTLISIVMILDRINYGQTSC